MGIQGTNSIQDKNEKKKCGQTKRVNEGKTERGKDKNTLIESLKRNILLKYPF